MDNHESEGVKTGDRFAFLAEAPAENIVRAVLVMLQSHHEIEVECLNEILAARFSDSYLDKLAATWLRIKAASPSDAEALCRFTQIVAAELERGKGPNV